MGDNDKEGPMGKTSKAVIIKRYLESGEEAKKVTMSEMKNFKVACSEEEWKEYAKGAAEALGIPMEEVDL